MDLRIGLNLVKIHTNRSNHKQTKEENKNITLDTFVFILNVLSEQYP